MRVYDITAFSSNNARGAVLERENKRKLEKEKNIYTSLKIERIVLKISRYFLPSLFLPLLLQIPHLENDDAQIAKSDSKPFSLPNLERVIITTTKIKKNRKSDAKKELLCLKPRKKERKKRLSGEEGERSEKEEKR